MKSASRLLFQAAWMAITPPLMLWLAFLLSKSQRWHYDISRTWKSPGEQYEVRLYRNRLWGFIPMAPGGVSDAPGVVELVDLKYDRVLGWADVEMVQMVTGVEWYKHSCRVSDPFFPTWKLPREADDGPYANGQRWGQVPR